MVGIELDRGLLVSALVAAGYQVVAVNPLQASRYRKRHGTSGAKSDRGDAKVLADLVRTDRHNHRPVAGRATWPRPSGCWLGPISRPSGAVNASSTACGRRCGPFTRQPWTHTGPPADRPAQKTPHVAWFREPTHALRLFAANRGGVTLLGMRGRHVRSSRD